MFVRTKTVKGYTYLQVVENVRQGRTTRQRVIANLGRLDRLQAEDDIETLWRSLSRFRQQVQIQQAHARTAARQFGDDFGPVRGLRQGGRPVLVHQGDRQSQGQRVGRGG